MTTNYVTNRQIGFILLLTLMAFIFVSIPKIAFEAAGTGAWFSILLTSIIFCISAFLMVYLGNMYRDMTIIQYCPKILGKYISVVILIIYAIYFFVIFTFVCHSISKFIKTDLLPKTPELVITIVLVASAGYAASKGLTNLGRLFEFAGFILIFSAIIIHGIMFLTGDTLNIRPFYNPSLTRRYLWAVKDLLVAFSGIELLLLIPIGVINGKKIVWISCLFTFFVGLFYVFIVETSAIMIGSSDIVNYWDALLVAIRRTQVPFVEFLRRLDIVFFVVGIMAMFCSISMLYYASVEFINGIFKKINRTVIILAVGAINIMVNFLITKYGDGINIYSLFISYSIYYTAFLIPLLLVVVSKVRKYGA